MRILVPLLFVVASCAGGARSARDCAPLPEAYQAFDGLHRECEVDRRARVIGASQADFSRLEPLINSSSGCYRADYTLVVDERGNVMPGSARLIRTNSQSYANAIADQIGGLRFQPAERNGAPVRQLYEYKATLQYRVSAGTPSTARRPPPC